MGSGGADDGARSAAPKGVRLSVTGHARAEPSAATEADGPAGHRRRQGRGVDTEVECQRERCCGAGAMSNELLVSKNTFHWGDSTLFFFKVSSYLFSSAH